MRFNGLNAETHYELIALAAACLFSLSPSASAAPMYTATRIGVNGIGTINDSGTVTLTSGYYVEGLIYKSSGPDAGLLKPIPGNPGNTYLSNSGQVATTVTTPGWPSFQQAEIVQNGQATVLPLPTGYQNSVTTGINDAGDITGYMYSSAGYMNAFIGSASAFYYHAGQVTPIGPISQSMLDQIPTAINSSGAIVGTAESTTASGATDAFLYSNGTYQDLGNFGARIASPTAINDKGQIALNLLGTYNANDPLATVLSTNSVHAYIYNNGQLTALQPLPGDTYTRVLAMNNMGTAVGYSFANSDGRFTDHAVVWQNGIVTDLTSATAGLNGFSLVNVASINNLGQITANAMGPDQEMDGSFILTPAGLPVPPDAHTVPEPSTLAAFSLLAAGSLTYRRLKSRKQAKRRVRFKESG